MAGKEKKNRRRRKKCKCLNCDKAKPFDDGRPGVICDFSMEACFMDCINCESWTCTYARDHGVVASEIPSQELQML